MKKSATYYLLLICLLNALCAYSIVGMIKILLLAYKDTRYHLTYAELPIATQMLVSYGVWPYVVLSAMTLVSFGVCAMTKIRNDVFMHVAVIVLTIDVLIMWFMFIVSILPFLAV